MPRPGSISPRPARRPLARGLLVAVLGLASAGMDCGPPGLPPDAAPEPGLVMLGTGTVAFERLEPEQPLILWAGPQGGHHFIVHARIQDMEPGDPTMPGAPGNPLTLFSAFDEAGVQVDLKLPPYALGYRPQDDGWHNLPSGRLLRTDEPLVEALFGKPVRIRVDVRDVNGRVASDQIWIIATRESPTDEPHDPGDPDDPDDPDDP